MVELTIGDLLRWKPAQLRLVGDWEAQRAALERAFSWAVCIRSTTPVLPPLRGWELVVVPHDVLDELDELESIRWPQVVAHLRTLPIAGVITDHPGLGEGVEDLLVIEVAATAGAELEATLNREFTERRGSLYQLGSELARTFSSASIGGSDLDGFLRIASQRGGLPVALIAATGRVLAASDSGLSVPPSLADPDSAGKRLNAQGLDWISQPVSGIGLPEGVVIVTVLAAAEPGDRARLLLEQAGEALGLMFDRLPPLGDVSPGREASEILSEFATSGELLPAARRRLAQVAGRVDLDGPLRVLAGAARSADAPLSFEYAGSRFRVIDEAAFRAIVASDAGPYAASQPFNGIERLPRVVGPVAQALRLQAAGHIARGRLDLGAPGSGGVLGLFLALESGVGEAGAQQDSYVAAMLGALEDYDRARGMELVETLGVYLDSGASVAAAAERLGVHRNTLAYRIARIVDVSGHELADPATRFDLQLAIALRRLRRA